MKLLRNHFPALFSVLSRRASASPDFKERVATKDTIVFVYGTLKRNHSNSSVLAECKYLGEAVTILGDFCMYDTGNYYPMVANEKVAQEHKGRILGEAFAVPPHILSRLDILEGCPTIFNRISTWIVLKGQMDAKSEQHPVVKSFMYVGKPSVMHTRMNRSFTRPDPNDKPQYFYKWYRVNERKEAIDTVN